MSQSLKVLFANRPNIASLPGGDVVQMKETAAELEKLGVSVRFTTEVDFDASNVDLVHVFNLETPSTTLAQAQSAKRQNKPVVLSTIYWDLGDTVRFESFFTYGRWPLAKRMIGRTLSHRIWQAMYQRTVKEQSELLKLVDGILPNSQLEDQHIRRIFSLPANYRTWVVTNAVRPEKLLAGQAARFKAKYGLDEFVLEVGRIGFIKNQLNVLKALLGFPHPIVFIGGLPDPDYLRLCQNEARGRQVLFIDHLEPDQLVDAYAAARVHVLPSQKETVGLVSLEAALAGCRIVATRNGGGPEYLKDWAYYCDPNNLESIHQAVERAWDSPPPTELAHEIQTQRTWAKAAEQTLAAYSSVLNR